MKPPTSISGFLSSRIAICIWLSGFCMFARNLACITFSCVELSMDGSQFGILQMTLCNTRKRLENYCSFFTAADALDGFWSIGKPGALSGAQLKANVSCVVEFNFTWPDRFFNIVANWPLSLCPFVWEIPWKRLQAWHGDAVHQRTKRRRRRHWPDTIDAIQLWYWNSLQPLTH